MTIGQKIYELRTAKNISQEQLALDLGVSRQAVSKWETDQCLPDLDKIKILANYFNTTIDYLANDEQDTFVPTQENVNTNIDKINKLKRASMVLMKTGAWYLIVYYIEMWIIILNQKNILAELFGSSITGFIMAYPLVIFNTIGIGFIVTFSYLICNNLKKEKRKPTLEIILISVGFIIYIISILVATSITNTITNNSNVEYIKGYSLLSNVISKYNWVRLLGSLLVVIGSSISISATLINNSSYNIPKNNSDYTSNKGILSFLIGLFGGVLGLIFTCFWQNEIKKYSREKAKKLLKWYLIGLAISIVISILVLIIKILFA